MSDAAERAPLLPIGPGKVRAKRSRIATCTSVASTIVIALISFLLAALIFAVLLGSSFWPSPSEIDVLQTTAFRYSTTPDRLSIVNITDEGVLVDVTVRCGIDVDRALGIGLTPAQAEHAAKMRWRGAGAEWWERLREWSVDRARGYVPGHVHLDVLEPIHVSWNGTRLVTATIVGPAHVPVVQRARIADKQDWLRPMDLRILAKPDSMDALWTFVQHSWREKVQVAVKTEAVGTVLGYSLERSIDMPVSLKLPRIPGVDSPGDIAKLVHLDAYKFESKGDLLLSARATVKNPIPFDYIVPSLPVAAFLPGGLRMAEVITDPFNLSSDISVTMSGHVVAELNNSQALSTFLQNYLHGLDNPIIVDGMGTVPSFANITLPRWLLDALSSISVPVVFPGPKPPPRVIHSVTIERMRISESGGKMRASGLVVAQIDLPGGMEHMDLDVLGVLPDVVIYDGPVDDDRAFGHIRPDEYLESTTSKGDDVFNPYRLVVRAPIDNVPVDILPGKDRILRDFVRKIVFRGGASAGIDGNASVSAEIKGVKGTVELHDLPVRGETWVGRK